MGATTIFFNGRLISVPGSYSVVDASGLESVGLGAAGIVAVLGTGEGGKPVSAISEVNDFIKLNTPEKVRNTFRSGNLREVGDMLFAPSTDPNINAGASEVVAMKVNPATQSSASFPNAYGPCLELASADYGEFTKQVNISIGNGTTKGKLLTIQFEDTIESIDDLGGDAIFQLTYVKPTNGWDTMVAGIDPGGILFATATRVLPNDTTIIGSWTGGDPAIVVSDDIADVGLPITIYGSVGSVLTKETLLLNGTNPVTGTVLFDGVFGARIVGTIAGDVTISDSGGVQGTLSAGTDPMIGLTPGSTMYVSGGKVSAITSNIAGAGLALIGYSPTGSYQAEFIAIPDDATTVLSVGNYSEIAFMGVIAGALESITVSAEALRATTVQNTIQKLSDFVNAKKVGTDGFALTIVTGLLAFNPSNLDITTGAGGVSNALSPATPSYYADLWGMIDWINNNSQYVTASAGTGAIGGAPTNTVSPVYLSGGSEGTALFSHWQAALNLLKKIRVNTVLALTGDPAVHAACDSHCAYMGGIGRSERDHFAGLMNTGLTDIPSKNEIKSQIINLNSRHTRAFAQAIERYNTAGERQEFMPYFQAAIAAGMQAGSPIGQSLTHKYATVLSLRQHSTWNPVDDAEEMIQAGLCFMENIDGVGRRVVRNVTTHLSTSNICYTEGSVNEAVNFAVYNFRTNMEAYVGARGFAGTIAAAKSAAISTLGLEISEGMITTYRSLTVELVLDVLEVGVEISPILPINFVKNTIHLVAIRQAA